MLFVELPSLLPVVELAEALLHVQNGAWLLCRVVANSPDSFYEGICIAWLSTCPVSIGSELLLSMDIIMCLSNIYF